MRVPARTATPPPIASGVSSLGSPSSTTPEAMSRRMRRAVAARAVTVSVGASCYSASRARSQTRRVTRGGTVASGRR